MKNQCLICKAEKKTLFFQIKNLPLVDSFLKNKQKALKVPRFSVFLYQCSSCKTIQINKIPNINKIYQNYIYTSSSSPDLHGHFKKYATFVNKLLPKNNASVVEIGANDGLLLNNLKRNKIKLLTAIDPSPQTKTIKNKKIKIINSFFDKKSCKEVPRCSVDVIIANNCFSHIPNLKQIFLLCDQILKEKGILIIEIQSTLSLLEKVIFDYIYHEHLFYHTVTSIEKVASLGNLNLFQVIPVETKGGSYRMLFGKKNIYKKTSSVDYWKYREKISKVHSASAWLEMKHYLITIKNKIHKIIDNKKYNIFGYGACATGTVFLKFMDLENKIRYLVDNNPARQNSFAPATGIPVFSPEKINKNDCGIILAWRHQKIIIKKLKKKKINKIIVPLPEIKTSFAPSSTKK